jgi:hypothetical protein
VREGRVGVTAEDNRLFVEAVLYRAPDALPGGHSVARFTREIWTVEGSLPA